MTLKETPPKWPGEKLARRESGRVRKWPREKMAHQELSHGKNGPGRKWPSSVLSITESFRTFPLVILVFQIKICDFMQNMQNFQFLFKKAKPCIKCHIITDLSYQSYSLLCHLLHHSIYAYLVSTVSTRKITSPFH